MKTLLNWLGELVAAILTFCLELAKLTLWLACIPAALVVLLVLVLVFIVPATFALLFMPRSRMEWIKSYFRRQPRKKKKVKLHPAFRNVVN